MKKAFGIPIALIGIAAIAKYFKDTGLDLIKMKTAEGYLELLKGLRYLMIDVISLIFLALFLIAGVVMAEAGIIFLVSEHSETRMILLLIFGAANITIALAVLLYVFSSRRWFRVAARTNKTLAKMLKRRKI